MQAHLTYEQFAAGAQLLAAWWQQHQPLAAQWQWVTKEQPVTGTVLGYLESCTVPAAAFVGQEPAGQHVMVVEAATPVPAHAPAAGGAAGTPEGDAWHLGAAAGAPDEACVPPPAAATAATVALLRLHIAYHPSFQVPVMYMRASRPDGGMLVLAEMLRSLPSLRRYQGSTTPDWAFLTQMEHPVLQEPWYALHPCQTADMLALLLQQASGHSQAPAAEGASSGPLAQPKQVAVSGGQTHTGSAAPAGHAAAASGGPGIRAQAVGGCGLGPQLLRYMLGWVSIVGPLVSLNVPPVPPTL